MTAECPIRVTCSTKKLIKEQSLIFDADGNPIEPYDSIIRRGMKELEKQRTNKIDVSKL